MNNESPLVPQGSFLEQKNKGRARVKIAVFIVLAIHGLGLVALLMQGCKKGPDTTAGNASTNTMQTSTTAAPPPFLEQTNVVTTTAVTPPAPIQSTQATPNTTPSVTDTTPQGVTSHKVVKGDTFAKLAKDYKVSVKAIEAANPGIDPLRLKVDQVVQIPAPAPAAVASTAGTGASAEPGSGRTHKVKSGENLIKIANQHGVTVKALRASNGLKTDRIKVGDVLKIPAKNGSATTAGGSSPESAGTSAALTSASNTPTVR